MKKFSLFTEDLDHCYVCGRPYPQIHHIMNASNKAKSEEYGLILAQCYGDHDSEPAEEVRKFVDKWESFVRKELKKA